MPSPLVCEVRQLIRTRTDNGQPLTMPERALLLATLQPPRRHGGDVVDELDAAITAARVILLGEPPRDWTPAQVEEMRRSAAKRLLAAARAVLDHTPPPEDVTAAMPTERLRPERADVDG